jgi:hypothetical protein
MLMRVFGPGSNQKRHKTVFGLCFSGIRRKERDVSPYFEISEILYVRVMAIGRMINHGLSNVDDRRTERCAFCFLLDFPPSGDQNVPSS